MLFSDTNSAAGWAIFKNGSAEFNNIILPGGQGVSVYFASSAPTTTHVGDLWYNISNGLELSRWSGSAWVAYQIGTGAIASGAITNSLLAASVTARSIGGITTTISGTAPSSPNAGDMWIDSANGYQLQQYNGTSWTAITFNAQDVIQAGTVTASQIQAGTITASLLAAGIVVAGIVDGTTIQGATLVADGTSGQILVYSGTPASGNLIASISGASGTDSHGNAYKDGFTVYHGTADIQVHVNSTVGAPAIEMPTGLTSEYDWPSVYNLGINSGAVNERENLIIQGPGSTYDKTSYEISMLNSAKDGSFIGYGALIWKDSTGTLHEMVHWDNQGLHVIQGSLYGGSGVLPIGDQIARKSSGFSGYPNINGTDSTSFTNTGTTFGELTSAWLIPANDAGTNNTTYRLKCGGFGKQGSTAQALSVQFNMFGVALGFSVTASGDVGTSTNFHWEAEGTLTLQNTGTSASYVFYGHFSWGAAASGSSSHYYAMHTGPTSGMNTTIAQEAWFEAHWGSTTGGPTITGIGSTIERMGQ